MKVLPHPLKNLVNHPKTYKFVLTKSVGYKFLKLGSRYKKIRKSI